MSASSLFKRFSGRLRTRVMQTGIRYAGRWLTRPARPAIDIPKEFAFVGRVSALEYDAQYDGEFKLARHAFAPGARPLLAVGTGRGQAFLVGDRYRFTDRGFIDYDGNTPIEFHEAKCAHCGGALPGKGRVRALKED